MHTIFSLKFFQFPQISMDFGASPEASSSFRGHTVKNSFGRGRSTDRHGRQFAPLSCCDWWWCRKFVSCVVLCGTDLDRLDYFLQFVYCTVYIFRSSLMSFDAFRVSIELACGRLIFALVRADNDWYGLIFYAFIGFCNNLD